MNYANLQDRAISCFNKEDYLSAIEEFKRIQTMTPNLNPPPD
jgi:hypothetical protein